MSRIATLKLLWNLFHSHAPKQERVETKQALPFQELTMEAKRWDERGTNEITHKSSSARVSSRRSWNKMFSPLLKISSQTLKQPWPRMNTHRCADTHCWPRQISLAHGYSTMTLIPPDNPTFFNVTIRLDSSQTHQRLSHWSNVWSILGLSNDHLDCSMTSVSQERPNMSEERPRFFPTYTDCPHELLDFLQCKSVPFS